MAPSKPPVETHLLRFGQLHVLIRQHAEQRSDDLSDETVSAALAVVAVSSLRTSGSVHAPFSAPVPRGFFGCFGADSPSVGVSSFGLRLGAIELSRMVCGREGVEARGNCLFRRRSQSNGRGNGGPLDHGVRDTNRRESGPTSLITLTSLSTFHDAESQDRQGCVRGQARGEEEESAQG